MTTQSYDSRLDRMFFPRSVAVVGASDIPAKWGNLVLTSILGWKFGGEVFPVNPSKETILGLKSYPSLKDIPHEVDLAVFTIPAPLIPQGLRDCAAKGIQAAVIISSGFREAGEEGAALEREIVKIARENGILFIGPNTMGIASAHHFFECLPAPTAPGPGGVAVISQSGNIGLQLIKWIAHKGIGLAMYAGTGNESVLKASDLMHYLGLRDEVKVIAMYIEGIDDGRSFSETAREVSRSKPVIAIKTGRSQAGSMAAQSHTGSMAGSFATYSAMFRQSGIIQVMTPTELINLSAAAAHLPIPRSNRVGIMTMGGGWGIIAADECEDSGLELPPLPESIISELDPILPAYWNRRNPVDVVGENDPSLYLSVIGALARWEEVDSVIALGIVGRSRYVEDFIAAQERLDGRLYSRELKLAVLKDQVRTEERIISGVAALQKETGKPIIVVGLNEGGLRLSDTSAGRVVNLSSPEEAVFILSRLAWYGKYRREYGA
ncbi:MAG: CoA-binding protein [Desulfomonilia bacterium]|jgi:acyl-CoA synthetase (NDP forming)